MGFGFELMEKDSLKLCKAGSDYINFQILTMLPLKEKEIYQKLGRSSMPINRRIQKLMDAGLIERRVHGGSVELSGLGKLFLNLIGKLQKDIFNLYGVSNA